jgi:NH3-dependent NAD+ synthetase
MQLTKQQLKQIIKEELESVFETFGSKADTPETIALRQKEREEDALTADRDDVDEYVLWELDNLEGEAEIRYEQSGRDEEKTKEEMMSRINDELDQDDHPDKAEVVWNFIWNNIQSQF